MRMATGVVIPFKALVIVTVFLAIGAVDSLAAAPVSVASVSFEATRIGTSSSPKIITIKNRDISSLIISKVTATPTTPSDITAPDLSAEMALAKFS